MALPFIPLSIRHAVGSGNTSVSFTAAFATSNTLPYLVDPSVAGHRLCVNFGSHCQMTQGVPCPGELEFVDIHACTPTPNHGVRVLSSLVRFGLVVGGMRVGGERMSEECGG